MTAPTLTPAERHVLELDKRGYTDAEIALVFETTSIRVKEMRVSAQSKLAPVSTGDEHWNR
jgi:DNA-binding NarL/FixJ family response regulator